MRPNQKVTVQPQISQAQKNAPRLYQAMEVLELSLPALIAHIEEAVAENPALEIEEGEYPEPPKASPQDQVSEDSADTPSTEDIEFESYNFEKSISSLSQDMAWDPEDNSSTLATTLHSILGMTKLDPAPRYLAGLIIDSLDEQGYLDLSIPDLLKIANQNLDNPKIRPRVAPSSFYEQDIQVALSIVQNLGIPGIGAKNLSECLTLQLQAQKADTLLAQQIISVCLPELINHQYELIAKKTGASLNLVRQAVSLISRLNPHPGSAYDSAPVLGVRPEIVFFKTEGRWSGDIVESQSPSLRISHQYAQMAKRTSSLDPSTLEYLKIKLASARNLIEAIEQRKRTMKLVAREIAQKQTRFLESGIKYLEPMTMESIAKTIGVHKSTVSRVCKDRYAETPFGLWPLKNFFTSGVTTGEGEGASSESIKVLIKGIIKEENPIDPISDTDIHARLQATGIDIARRTVAKYRELAGIPPARQRRF